SLLAHAPPSSVHPLSLHDALPIFRTVRRTTARAGVTGPGPRPHSTQGSTMSTTTDPARVIAEGPDRGDKHDRVPLPFRQRNAVVDRKSTRLNSSHVSISYAVFCLK